MLHHNLHSSLIHQKTKTITTRNTNYMTYTWQMQKWGSATLLARETNQTPVQENHRCFLHTITSMTHKLTYHHSFHSAKHKNTHYRLVHIKTNLKPMDLWTEHVALLLLLLSGVYNGSCYIAQHPVAVATLLHICERQRLEGIWGVGTGPWVISWCIEVHNSNMTFFIICLGQLQKLCTLKADQNRLMELPASLGK